MEITIANAHSEHKPTQKIKVKLEGGSPYFAYIWIDDILYVLTKGSRTVKIKKLK